MCFTSRIAVSWIAGSLLAGAALAAENQISPQELRANLAFVAERLAQIKADPGPVADEVAPGGLLRDFSFDQARRGLTLWQQSFHFSAYSDKSELLFVESDPYDLPGSELAAAKLAWTGAKSADGRNLIDPDHNQPEDHLATLGDVAQTKVALAGGAGDVQRLEGLLTVRYPKGLSIAEFPTNDTLSRKALKTITCRLLESDNDLATIWCNAWGNGVAPFPVSASGAVLATRDSIMGLYAMHQEIKKSGWVSDAMLDNLAASPADAEKDGLVFVVKAKGKIAKLVAMEPVGWQEEKVKIEARRLPDFYAPDCPDIPHPRYAPTISPATFAIVDEASIKAGTQILAARSEAATSFNEHMIRIQLPRLVNSLLAQLDLTHVVLMKGAKTVTFIGKVPLRDDPGYVFSYRMDNGTKAFNKIAGTVELRYPVKVVTRKVSAGLKDAVVSIRGCEVDIVGGDVEVDADSRHPSVRAYAANGMPLKVAGDSYYHGSRDGIDYAGLRFWGTVAAVEVDEVAEWKTVSFPLNLKPAPALRRP